MSHEGVLTSLLHGSMFFACVEIGQTEIGPLGLEAGELTSKGTLWICNLIQVRLPCWVRPRRVSPEAGTPPLSGHSDGCDVDLGEVQESSMLKYCLK